MRYEGHRRVGVSSAGVDPHADVLGPRELEPQLRAAEHVLPDVLVEADAIDELDARVTVALLERPHRPRAVIEAEDARRDRHHQLRGHHLQEDAIDAREIATRRLATDLAREARPRVQDLA